MKLESEPKIIQEEETIDGGLEPWEGGKETTQHLEDKFRRVLEKEKKPGEPEIFIEIFYAPHRTEKDIKDLKRYFRWADIYIPEAYGWTPEILEDLKDLSCGKITPEGLFNEKWKESPETHSSYFEVLEELRTIYNSRKPLIIIDVPEGHPIEQRKDKMHSRYFFYSFGKNFTNELGRFKEYLKEDADIYKEREEHMLSQIKPRIRDLLEKNPAMKKKKRIKILLFLGSIHTGVWHTLKKGMGKRNVAAHFRPRTHIFDFRDEAVRRYIFRREIDDELAAKALLEREFSRWGLLPEEKISETYKIDRLLRIVISRFSFDEIKEMFSQSQRVDDLMFLFGEKLKEKGIEIPETEEELDEFLGIRDEREKNKLRQELDKG